MTSCPHFLHGAPQGVFLPWRLLATSLVLLVSCFASVRAAAAESRTVTIAVVRDGPSVLLDDVDAAFRREASAVLAGRASLVFRQGGTLDAGWRDGEAPRALDAALADPSVDYVIALGVRVASAAAAPDRVLGKPVLGAVLQESDLAPLPIDAAGRSGKPNFAVVTLPGRAEEQLAELRPLVPFLSLHVLVDEFFAPGPAALEPWRAELSRRLGVPVTLSPLAGSADAALASLGADARAVYLLPSLRLDEAGHAALLKGLVARRLPVLSYLGQREVEAGALAGTLPNPGDALARRLAINLDQLLGGQAVSALSLRITLPAQLYFNEDTASGIGFSAGLAAAERAVLIGRARTDADPVLTFTDALTLALKQNYSRKAQETVTEASRQGVKSARGALLPQVTASFSYSAIDRDRAAASGGFLPRNTTRAGAGVSQVLLDDESFTRVRIARESLRQSDYFEQAERLDTMQVAGQTYLQLLSAQAALRVAEDNFRVTQRNLELARLRLRVGTAGPEEGYRFESLSAQQRADLAAARAATDRARVALNRALGADVDTRWRAREVTMEDPAFAFTTGRLTALVSDRQKLDRFRTFAAAYAAKNSPDIAAIERAVETSRLSADERKRRHYVPKIYASVDYSHVLGLEAGGPSFAEQFRAAGLPVGGSPANRDDWTAGITVSLPIFSGGTTSAEARRARAEQRRAEFSRDAAREAVMAQAQSALFNAESAYVNIDFSRQSADLAERNLAVVQDKYERGSVPIVTLLDAQSAAFAQRQSASAAVYRFFNELLSFQRALGWIEALATDAEKDAWLRETEQAVTR